MARHSALSHTNDNRDKRKSLQEHRDALGKRLEFVGNAAQEGQKTANALYASIESALALAKHAGT